MRRSHRRTLLLSAVFIAFLPFALTGRAQSSDDERGLEPRTVILVRHAEKDLEGDPQDPKLTAAGSRRAAELAQLLAHAGVTRLVASEYERTQATLAPLADRTGLSIDTRPARELEALADELGGGEPGSVAVVCGHSNTIPALAARLGTPLSDLTTTPHGPMLDESEYDRLFVLYLPPQQSSALPKALELRYGE